MPVDRKYTGSRTSYLNLDFLPLIVRVPSQFLPAFKFQRDNGIAVAVKFYLLLYN